MSTTISKTVFTFTVLHRTDEPFQGIPGAYDGLDGEPLMEALRRSYDGNAVGLVTSEVTEEVPDERVEDELVQLHNDGEFFSDDIGTKEDQ